MKRSRVEVAEVLPFMWEAFIDVVNLMGENVIDLVPILHIELEESKSLDTVVPESQSNWIFCFHQSSRASMSGSGYPSQSESTKAIRYRFSKSLHLQRPTRM